MHTHTLQHQQLEGQCNFAKIKTWCGAESKQLTHNLIAS